MQILEIGFADLQLIRVVPTNPPQNHLSGVYPTQQGIEFIRIAFIVECDRKLPAFGG